MLLVILLSLLLSTSVAKIIDVSPSDDLSSNETTEEIPPAETDLEWTTIREATQSDEDGEVYENEGTDESCGVPPVVRNAIIDGGRRADYEIGTEVTYSCEFGYSTTDGTNHVSRCLLPGDKPSWTDPEIICIPRSCGDPGFVLNAHRIGSRFTFPNEVSFECDDGYELRGSATRYCQVSGVWSGSLPSCEKIFCDQPFHPENGRVSYSSLEYGSELKYECEKGFILKNHQKRECLENGTWSGTDPICLDAQCVVPDAPDHGSVEVMGGDPRVGSIAIYKCESERTLLGSATSKCLDIGEWTFPAPQCVEPCIVPSVEHGHIGRYEAKRWSRNKVYTQLSVGMPLKDDEELYLRCDNQYEPLGRNKREENVICGKGQWQEIPTCEPARCRSKPPEMQNGRAGNINREHSQYVVYFCSRHFKKTKSGNVTCHFGAWTGVPPTCSDTRCYVDKIQFPGLSKGRKNIFKNREVFAFDCEKGYDVVESEKKLVCEEGAWKGHFPPCKAASCSSSPPAIQNGRIKSYSELHSSVVSYECDDGYFLVPADVQCLFGEWKGTPPVCKEGRCYFQNLKEKSGIVAPSKDPTNSGETLEVKCASGFSALSIRPLCSDGRWTEYGTSPCRSNSCLIEQIRNGALTSCTEKKIWNWRRMRHDTEISHEMVRIGSVKSAGESLYISCYDGYTFQGKNKNFVQAVCREGRWKPTPVCLPYGTRYEERDEIPAIENQGTITANQPKTSSTTTSPGRQNPTVTSNSPAIELESTEAKQKQAEECYCLYEGSNDLVAYSGHELLKSGSQVKKNASVKFYCSHFGYHRFMGSREIVCRDCKPWHSSEYPSCVVPVKGDVTFQLDAQQIILPGGILTLDQGADTQINCISKDVGDYPVWSSTVSLDDFITYNSYDRSNGEDMYFNVLSIRNANSQHSGYYKCSVGGKRAREIQICIHTKCKKFDESEEFFITYDNKQEVNSSVLFKCKDSNRNLEGQNLLTCLSNGEWSGPPPTCVFKGCPKLAETETMLITYSHGLATDSTAVFHCFAPRVRKGGSYIKCLPNGKWSGTPPSCTLPRCPLEKLFEHVPENVVPRMENVQNETLPRGYELHLTCDGDLRLSEEATAKCGNNGEWEVPKVSCVPGCSPLQVPPGSNLVVDPERDFYRFGEYVSLLCKPGHVLSAEVEILMCLRNGWSESTLPTCIDPSLTD